MSLAEQARSPVDAQAGEVHSINPELQTGSHAEVLRELLTVDDEVAAANRPKIYEAAAQLSATIFNPQAQYALELYAGIADWYMFGKSGAQLPRGLYLYQDQVFNHRVVEPRLDAAFPYLHSDIDTPHMRLGSLGLHEVTSNVVSHLEQRRAQVEAVVRDFIMQSNEYAVLAACEQHAHQDEPLPLNAYWQQIRESQEAAVVRNRYAINPGMAISRDNPAHFDLQQRIHRVSEETMRQPEKRDQNDGLERARKLLMDYVVPRVKMYEDDVVPATAPNSSFSVSYDASYESVPMDYACLKLMYSGTELRSLSSLFRYFAMDFCSDYYNGDPAMKYIAVHFMFDVLGTLLNPKLTGGLLPHLNKVVEIVTERATDYLTSYSQVRHSYGMYENANEIMLLKRPEADTRTYLERGRGKWWELMYHANSFASREEYEELVNTQIAEIDRYEPARYRVPLRLVIGNDTQTWRFPQVAEREDLVIRGLDEFGDELQIPGFTQVSYDYDALRYGFVINLEGDPYATCNTPIEPAHKAKLIEAYQQIGLSGLVESLEAASQLTVAELVALIRQHSVYHLPDNFSTEHSHESHTKFEARRPSLHELSDFGGLVQDKKLYLQCTSAATFLKRSLELGFEHGAVGSVSGKTIDPYSRIIHAAGHVQVTFLHEGKLYILDATPALDIPISEAYEPLDAAEDYEREQQPATILPLEIPDRPQEVGEYFEQPDVTPEAEIAGLYASLQQQLKIVFEQSDVAGVEKQVIKLAKHDPVRRMYESFARYQSGRVGPEQAGDLAVYIAGCSTSPEATRRKLGIHRYTPEFLEQLASMSHRFHQLSLQLQDD